MSEVLRELLISIAEAYLWPSYISPSEKLHLQNLVGKLIDERNQPPIVSERAAARAAAARAAEPYDELDI
jgi:hypothetical protein